MLALPAKPADCLAQVIAPALGILAPAMDSPEARVLLLAIAGQESGLLTRRQPGGPALGLWQFETGGVRGVLRHNASADAVIALCANRRCSPITVMQIYNSLEFDDLLACGIARLLLYTDAAPLPEIGDSDAAWNYYKRNWRPGAPRPAAWGFNYSNALKAQQLSDAA